MVERLLSIQHRLNPLHVYCRLLDKGFERSLSALLCKSYETIIFFWISLFIKTMIYFLYLIKRGIGFQEKAKKN